MLLTKTVKKKPAGGNIKHLREKGYEFKVGEEIEVKVEDLPSNSHIKVDVLCDYCKEKIMTVKLQAYTKGRKIIPKDCCKECQPQKVKETNMKLYGVEYKAQLQSTKDKTRKTNMKKYGVPHVF